MEKRITDSEFCGGVCNMCESGVKLKSFFDFIPMSDRNRSDKRDQIKVTFEVEETN